MATVSLSSAIYNASTRKYLVVLENAKLIKNDATHQRLTIELKEEDVTIQSTPRISRTGLGSTIYSYGVESAFRPVNVPNFSIILADEAKNTMNINHGPKQTKNKMFHITAPKQRLCQSGTSPIHQIKANISKSKVSQHLSSYFSLVDFDSTQYKTNVIKRLLTKTTIDKKDIVMYLPSKYENKYRFIEKINGGLQGCINTVKCRETNVKYCMKTMKYKNQYQLRQHLERYLIVTERKFMDYKDVFIDINNNKLHIIQTLLKHSITEKLCSLKTRQFDKLQLNKIILQLIEKMDVIHAAGFVHHDIKPENIMFDERGNLHIIDFDLMETIGSKIATKGTIGFMAPEVFLPEICSETAVDIWSIGSVLCYIAFHGNVPFNNIDDNNQRFTDLKQYVDSHSFLDETKYIENKWSFIVDIKMDYGDDYDPDLFRLIGDLLTFEANNRPNSSTLLTSHEYNWFNRKCEVT